MRLPRSSSVLTLTASLAVGLMSPSLLADETPRDVASRIHTDGKYPNELVVRRPDGSCASCADGSSRECPSGMSESMPPLGPGGGAPGDRDRPGPNGAGAPKDGKRSRYVPGDAGVDDPNWPGSDGGASTSTASDAAFHDATANLDDPASGSANARPPRDSSPESKRVARSREEREQARSRQDASTLGAVGQGIGEFLTIALVAILAAFLVFLLVRLRPRWRAAPAAEVATPEAPNPSEAPSLAHEPEHWLALRNYDAAIRALLLQALRRAGWRESEVGDTSREIVRRVPSSDPMRVVLDEMLRIAESVRFRGQPATAELYARVVELSKTLETQR